MEANNVSSVDTAEVAQATSYLKRTEDILQAEFSDLLPKDLFPDTFVSLQNRPKDLGNAACPEVALFGHGKDKDRVGAAHVFEAIAKVAERDNEVVVGLGRLPEYALLYFANFITPTMYVHDEMGAGYRKEWKAPTENRFVG